MPTTDVPTPEEMARRRAKYLTGLMWHVGTFIIINAFFWVLDLTTGQEGLNWAHWITLLWGFALAFHALAYLVDGRQVERYKAAQYLAEDRSREASSH